MHASMAISVVWSVVFANEVREVEELTKEVLDWQGKACLIKLTVPK